VIPTGNLPATALLDRLQALARERATIDAQVLQVLTRYRELRSRDGDFDERSVPAEIALALHVSNSHAESQLIFAQSLTERLPDTLEAMHDGTIDLAKARALADITHCLSAEDARLVEAKILPKAAERTLTQVRAAARYQRDRVDPAAAERRRQQAKAERDVFFTTIEDGSAELCVRGPGERVFLAWLLLDDLARRLRAAGDGRSLSALRHDLVLDLILGKGDSRVSMTAYLHLPATTLAGAGDDPGILSGYGPVTRQACQELAAGDATWRRVFTDPVSGVVKDMDRRTYRPSATLAEFVAVRDGTCVAPGCSRSAHNCQVDHTVRWADGGCTVEGNLDALCWPDHRLKDICGWTLDQPEPGRYVWTSPVGQVYERMPDSMFGP
jgi:hypothetical protein